MNIMVSYVGQYYIPKFKVLFHLEDYRGRDVSMPFVFFWEYLRKMVALQPKASTFYNSVYYRVISFSPGEMLLNIW